MPTTFGEKATMKEKPLTEKHPCEDTSLPYNERLRAILDDESLDDDQGLSAHLGICEKDWVATHKPPLFTAALSLDSASDKASAVEAALRAGADPNELDHEFPKQNNGRALAFFVDAQLHGQINETLDGIVNNLPAIEVMLRYGADPRLAHIYIGPTSARSHVAYGLKREFAPEFFEAARQMLDQAAEPLDERDRKSKGKGLDSLTKWSVDTRPYREYEPSILSRLLGVFSRLWARFNERGSGR